MNLVNIVNQWVYNCVRYHKTQGLIIEDKNQGRR